MSKLLVVTGTATTKSFDVLFQMKFERSGMIETLTSTFGKKVINSEGIKKLT